MISSYLYRTNKYDKAIILIILSLALGSIGGSFQLVRIISVLYLPFLLRLLRKCNYSKSFLISFALFLIFCVISLSWSLDREQGYKEILYYVIHFCLFLEIIVFSKYANNCLRSIAVGWLAAVSGCSIIAIWEFTTLHHLSIAMEETNTINAGAVVIDRFVASATFGNYNGYVTFLCFALPWIFYYLCESEKVIHKLFISIVILIATFTIIINASRGGILSLLFFYTIYLAYKRKTKAILILVIVLTLLIPFIIKHSDDLFLALTMKSGNDNGFTHDEGRSLIWGNTIKAFDLTNGIGTGVGSMKAALESVNSHNPSTHNLLLEILLQYGYIPTLAFVLYIFMLLKKAFSLKKSYVKMSVLMSFFSMPVNFIIDSGYLLQPYLFVLMATIYVFINYNRICANKILKRKN